MLKTNKIWQVIVLAAVVLIFLLPLWVKDPSKVDLLIKIGFAAVLGVSWRLIYTTGQLDVSRGAFVAIGAYASAIMTKDAGLPFWWAWPLSGAVAAVIGLGLGVPTLRVKGVYFVILTLAFNEVVRLVVLAWGRLTGGPDGIRFIPLPALGSYQATPKDILFFYIMAVMALVTVLVMYRLDKSRLGLTFRAIKQADSLGESLGINLMKYKVLAFVIACFFTGLAGSFFAHYNLNIAPYDFGLDLSFLPQIYAVVGGTGTVWGPVLGGALLIPVGRILLGYGHYDILGYGIILVAVTMGLPAGLASIPQRIKGIFRRRVRARASV